MSTRAASDKETGPRVLGGLDDAGTSGALPPVDLTVGAKQRFRVHVPTGDTTLMMGKRVQVTRTEDSTTQLGYDGLSAITDGHAFFASQCASATVQSGGRAYVVSLTSSLAAVAYGEVLIGSDQRSTTVAGKGAMVIVAGYGPKPTTVSIYGETPEDPSHANIDDVASSYSMAALVTTGCISVVALTLGLVGTPRAAWASSVAAYTLQSAGILSGSKAIAEAVTGKSLTSGFSDDVASGLDLHGKDAIRMIAGVEASSIAMFAPVGSIQCVGAFGAGLVGGLSASLSGILSASITGLSSASLMALGKASVVASGWASVDSRIGTTTVRAAKVDLGEIMPTAPQLPTVAATVQAAISTKLSASLLETPAIELNGILQTAKVTALKKITIEALPYTLEVTPLGVKIAAAGVPAVEVTPTKTALTQLTQKVELTPMALTMSSAASSVKVVTAGVAIGGLKVHIDPPTG